MRFLLLLLAFFITTACGGGKKKADNTATDTPKIVDPRTLQPTVKDSKILSKLRNTSWELPTYSVAGITFTRDGKASVSMSETSFLSNANVAILEEDDDIVVFNMYIESTNNVFSIKLVDPDTISIAQVIESNSIAGYKSKHDIFSVQMKKK